MSFDSQETGQETGRPIELFEFRRGGRQRAVYTSSDESWILGRTTYVPRPISVTPFERSSGQPTSITITLPYSDSLFEDFQPTPPEEPLDLIIRRIHLSDTPPGEEQFWFKGRQNATRISQGGTMGEIRFTDLASTLALQIPRHTYGTQ